MASLIGMAHEVNWRQWVILVGFNFVIPLATTLWGIWEDVPRWAIPLLFLGALVLCGVIFALFTWAFVTLQSRKLRPPLPSHSTDAKSGTTSLNDFVKQIVDGEKKSQTREIESRYYSQMMHALTVQGELFQYLRFFEDTCQHENSMDPLRRKRNEATRFVKEHFGEEAGSEFSETAREIESPSEFAEACAQHFRDLTFGVPEKIISKSSL